MSTTTKFSKPIDDEIGTLNRKLVFAGDVGYLRIANSGTSLATLRFYTSSTTYLELVLNSNSIIFRYYNGSENVNIWTK